MVELVIYSQWWSNRLRNQLRSLWMYLASVHFRAGCSRAGWLVAGVYTEFWPQGYLSRNAELCLNLRVVVCWMPRYARAERMSKILFVDVAKCVIIGKFVYALAHATCRTNQCKLIKYQGVSWKVAGLQRHLHLCSNYLVEMDNLPCNGC